MTQVMIAQSRATSKEVAASVKLRLILTELSNAASLPKEKRADDLVAANLNFYRDYREERDLSHELAESMDPAIENHYYGTEKYEWAQLWAEIALSIGSLSLILKNRYIWYVSLGMAALCVFELSSTRYHQIRTSTVVDEKVEVLDKEYLELRKKHSANDWDQIILNRLKSGNDGLVLPEGK